MAPSPVVKTAFIDHTSPVPVFLQIEQDLRRQILSGAFATGTQLPRETELAEKYGASRDTLRRALKNLAGAKLIRREHGVGTIVTPPALPVTCDLDLMVSFREQLSRQGHVSRTLVDTQKVLEPPEEIRDALRLGAKQTCVFLRRVVLIGNRPIVLNTSWLPARRFRGLEKKPLADSSLWKTLETDYDVRLNRSDNRIELVTASSDEARLLLLDDTVPLLRLSGLVFDRDDRIVEYSALLWSNNVRFHFSSRSRVGSPRR